MAIAHNHTTPGPTPRPFASQAGRWQQEVHRLHARARAAEIHRWGTVPRPTADPEGNDPTHIHEHTSWGWLSWQQFPGQHEPAVTQIGVRSPNAPRTARLASRWLTRRPARRIYFDRRCRFWVTAATALAALVSLIGVWTVMLNGLPASIGLPLMLLIPALAEHLPGRLDARARRWVRTVQGVGLRPMQFCAALQQRIQESDDQETPELGQAVRVGRLLLWDIAGLLAQRDPDVARERVLTSERLLTALARQVAQTRAAKDEREGMVEGTPQLSRTAPQCDEPR
ncbi:hypothetical protein [Streptomyces xanthochromogenes]|uniref:hypothetical protein n=1 Tax=Streptomyces xanthochromogenes TaxID=67384 RepID=UPI00344144B6